MILFNIECYGGLFSGLTPDSEIKLEYTKLFFFQMK